MTCCPLRGPTAPSAAGSSLSAISATPITRLCITKLLREITKHTRYVVGRSLLSEEPSEDHIFVFKLGNLTGLFKKRRGPKQRWCRETMNPSERTPADHNGLSKMSHRGLDRPNFVLHMPRSPDFMAYTPVPSQSRVTLQKYAWALAMCQSPQGEHKRKYQPPTPH